MATGSDGETPSISLYGCDAGLSQLPAETYRTVVHHRDVGPFALTRVQQIEHEAHMTLVAQRAALGLTVARLHRPPPARRTRPWWSLSRRSAGCYARCPPAAEHSAVLRYRDAGAKR